MDYQIVLVLAAVLCCANAAFTINVYEDDHEDDELQRSDVVRRCSLYNCNRICRNLGFSGGSCVNGRCICKSRKQSLAVDATDAVPDLESCNYRECDQLCRRLGFPGGACVGDRCKCDNFRPPTDALVSASDGVESCDRLECDQRCRGNGFPGGACLNDRCKCDIIFYNVDNEVQISNQDEGKQEVTEVIQNEANSDVKGRSASTKASCDCNPRNCDVYCFRIRYTGGICVTGQCRCYK